MKITQNHRTATDFCWHFIFLKQTPYFKIWPLICHISLKINIVTAVLNLDYLSFFAKYIRIRVKTAFIVRWGSEHHNCKRSDKPLTDHLYKLNLIIKQLITANKCSNHIGINFDFKFDQMFAFNRWTVSLCYLALY